MERTNSVFGENDTRSVLGGRPIWRPLGSRRRAASGLKINSLKGRNSLCQYLPSSHNGDVDDGLIPVRTKIYLPDVGTRFQDLEQLSPEIRIVLGKGQRGHWISGDDKPKFGGNSWPGVFSHKPPKM